MIVVIKLIFVIGAAVVLKKLKILAAEDSKILTKIMMYITLPCAMAASTQSLKMSGSVLWLGLIGFIINMAMLICGKLIGRDKKEKCLLMANLSALNIGGFVVPFLQNLFPASAIAIAGMYDVGNSFYGSGGTYLLTDALVNRQSKFKAGTFLKNILKSFALMSYVVALLFTLAGMRIPQALLKIIQSVGDCNFLIVFLMLGLVMEFKIDRENIGRIIRFIIIKYSTGIALSTVLYFSLPFDLLIRQVMVMCILAPQAATSVAYSQMLGCNPKDYGPMYTCSVLSTLVCYLVLSFLWGI